MPRIMTASVIPKKSKPTSRNSNSPTPSPRKKSDLTAAIGCAPRNQSPLKLRVIQTAHTLPMLPNLLAQRSTNPTRHAVESEMTKISNQARRAIGVPNGIGPVPDVTAAPDLAIFTTKSPLKHRFCLSACVHAQNLHNWICTGCSTASNPVRLQLIPPGWRMRFKLKFRT